MNFSGKVTISLKSSGFVTSRTTILNVWFFI